MLKHASTDFSTARLKRSLRIGSPKVRPANAKVDRRPSDNILAAYLPK
jgi:hypothetical protein